MPRAKKPALKTIEEPLKGRVEILVPFNGMYRGDTADVVVDATVQGWINAGLARLMEAVNGTDQAGQGAVVADDSWGEPLRAGAGSTSGDEPSQGFGTGSYGAFEG